MKIEFDLCDTEECVKIIKAIQGIHQIEVTIGEGGNSMYIQKITAFGDNITIVAAEYIYGKTD